MFENFSGKKGNGVITLTIAHLPGPIRHHLLTLRTTLLYREQETHETRPRLRKANLPKEHPRNGANCPEYPDPNAILLRQNLRTPRPGLPCLFLKVRGDLKLRSHFQ